MTRRLRLHVPGGFYHVTLRGNHRQPIFFRDEDHGLLDRLVADSLQRYNARLHAYCWMPNHLHLLVQVSDTPLGRLQLRIASAYARTVQLRLQTTGHLFERRHHAVLVDADSYLLTLVRYIHLNPVRAGIVTSAADYPWSSHLVYLGRRSAPWITTDFVLRQFATQRDTAVSRYAEFVGLDGRDRWGEGSLSPHANAPDILGDDAFVSRVLGEDAATRIVTTLDELVRECCARFETTLEVLASPSRAPRHCEARAWLGHAAFSRRAATISAVARLLRRSEAALRHAMRTYAPTLQG
jgi:REP element-mobilizing transposase RayT